MKGEIYELLRASSSTWGDPATDEVREPEATSSRDNVLIMREEPMGSGWEGSDGKARREGWDDLVGEDWWGWYTSIVDYVPVAEAPDDIQEAFWERVEERES